MKPLRRRPVRHFQRWRDSMSTQRLYGLARAGANSRRAVGGHAFLPARLTFATVANRERSCAPSRKRDVLNIFLREALPESARIPARQRGNHGRSLTTLVVDACGRRRVSRRNSDRGRQSQRVVAEHARYPQPWLPTECASHAPIVDKWQVTYAALHPRSRPFFREAPVP